VAVRSLLKFIVLSSLLLVGAAPANAQTPLGNLVSQVRTALVVVNTYDERGKALTQGSGFFIAPNRVLTNLRFLNSARDIRITTFSGKTVLVQSVVAKYLDADLAILQLSQPCLDVAPLRVKKFSANRSVVVLDNGKEAEWNVTPARVEGWSFEHVATHLQITASLAEANGRGPIVKLKGHLNGTAVSVPD
jgi:S1-C subfamily serine protease